jgi:hypothetical protein
LRFATNSRRAVLHEKRRQSVGARRRLDSSETLFFGAHNPLGGVFEVGKNSIYVCPQAYSRFAGGAFRNANNPAQCRSFCKQFLDRLANGGFFRQEEIESGVAETFGETRDPLQTSLDIALQ